MDNQNDNKENKEINISPDNNKANKAKQKKKVLIIFALLAVAIVVLPLLNMIDFDSMLPKEEETEQEAPEQTTTTLGDHHFKEPVYDEDITKDPEYMKLDRALYYTYMNETFGVMTKEQAAEHGAVCTLFKTYFDSAMAGDSDTFNSLFTNDYIKKNGKVKLAPQKLYDIKVECLSSIYLEDGDSNGDYKGYYLYEFDVAYSILENNGTLRKDFLGDEGQKPLVFKVIQGDGQVKISNVGGYVYTNEPKEPQKTFDNGILIIVLGALVALLILVEVFTKKTVGASLAVSCVIGVIIAAFNVDKVFVIAITAVLGLALSVASVLIFKKKAGSISKAKSQPESEQDN